MAYLRSATIATAFITLLALTSPVAALDVGQKAPDFELTSTQGGKLKLSSLKGKNVLINFYNLDFNPAWIQHLQSSGSDDNYAKFTAENTEVLGISVNTPFSQKAFVDFAKVKHALLSDADGKTMKAYGVYREEQRIGSRAYFIIDKDGVVRFKNVPPSGNPKFLLSTEALLNEVKKVNSMK